MSILHEKGAMIAGTLTALSVILLLPGSFTGYVTVNQAAAQSVSFIGIVILFFAMAIAAFSRPLLKTVEHHIKFHRMHEKVELRHLENFVALCAEKGFSREEITQGLLEYQWDEDLIEHAFAKTML